MADRSAFWGRMTPPEVRRASLWALAGAGVAFVVAPVLQPYGRLPAALVTALGGITAVWSLVRIFVAAPGWRVGMLGEFDERETAERHRALATSYLIVSIVVCGIVALSGLVPQARIALSVFGHPPPVAGGLLIIGMQALPGIVLAWRSRRIEQAIDDEA